MLTLTAFLTKETIAGYKQTPPEKLPEIRKLHDFLVQLDPTQLEKGFSFKVEAAKDTDGVTYKDLQLTITGRFVKNNEIYLLSNSGVFINIQPLINFLNKILT